MHDFTPRTIEQMQADAERMRAEWPDELPPVFSASAMGMLVRCPEQYRQRYLLGIKSKPGAAMIWGRADHAAIEDHYRKVIDTGAGLTTTEVKDRFAEYVDTEIEDAGGVGEIEWRDAPRKEIDTIKKIGTSMVAMYHDEIAPTVEPIGLEEEIEVNHPLFARPVVGYVDILEENTLIERKTSSRLASTPQPEWVWQGRIYQLAMPNKSCQWHVSVKHRSDPDKVRVNALLPVPPNPRMREATVMMLAQSMKQVEQLVTTYGPDHPWPGQGVLHPWACGYCGYRDGCSWWQE